MKSASPRITFTPEPDKYALLKSKAREQKRTVTEQLNHILEDWKTRSDSEPTRTKEPKR
jgi:hypothetical protein